MRKKSLIFVIFIFLLFPTLGTQVHAEKPSGGPPGRPAFVANEVVISFRPGVTVAEMANFYSKHNLVEKQQLGFGPDDGSRPRVAQIKPSAKEIDPAGLVRVLGQDPLVTFAELNFILTLNDGPNDPELTQLWGLNNSGQTGGTNDADIDAPEAWGITTGSPDVIVGIIDTGIDYNHPDLVDNMWTNPGEIPGNGLDDDGNGYIDDIHGINAITDSGDPLDNHGHGTHVAGTIGAKGNNALGVVGVNWNVRIVACKFLNSNGGGSIADATKCFMYFNHLKHQLVLSQPNCWQDRDGEA